MYKFSIIILASDNKATKKSIESIANQSMGHRSVQIVVLGSNKKIESTCKDLSKKNGLSILYKDTTGKGDSWKKNYGLKVARGKYVNYMEEGAEWSEGTLESVDNVFHERKRLSAVLCRRMIIDKDEYVPDSFTYKFKNDRRIANVQKRQSYFCVHLGPMFFNKALIKKHTFAEPEFSYDEERYVNWLLTEDRKLKDYYVCYEDVEFLTNIILEKGEYGLAGEESVYYAPSGKTRMADKGNERVLICSPKKVY